MTDENSYWSRKRRYCRMCRREAVRRQRTKMMERAGDEPVNYGPQSLSVRRRFENYIEIIGDCWLWQGYVNPTTGYGGFGIQDDQGRWHSIDAHRVSYMLYTGPIPDGLHLDHTCHTRDNCVGGSSCPHRRCVNPDHLEAVTQQINLLRGSTLSALNALKTACPQGHPYNTENTLLFADGQRRCRICRAVMKHRSYMNKKAS